MALCDDEPIDGEGGGRAQNGADVVRVGDLIERDDQPFRRQFRDVDRLDRPRFEQQALMYGVARQALRDLLAGDDLCLDVPLFDFRRKALGGGARCIEANELSPRRAQRSADRMEAVNARNVAAAARLVPARARIGSLRRTFPAREFFPVSCRATV